MTVSPIRRAWDLDAYQARARAACFICEMLAGSPGYGHHEILRDDVAVAFLAKYPAAWGHVLVAPSDHREAVAGDFTEDEYIELQRVVHRVGRAVTEVVPHERIYVLSLGSQAANAHVHWHVLPLPEGVPYERQQAALLDADAGWLDFPPDELSGLARRLRAAAGLTPAPAPPGPRRGRW